MNDFKTIDSEKVSGKRVLVRVDLNVPMKNGKVTDATRIERAAPTLAELAAKGAKVIVLSHFGRPDGKRVPEMSLKPLVEPLAKALGKPVAFAPPTIATTGRYGCPSALPSASSSACISRPASAGRRWATPSVEAWARWAAEKASLT